MEDLKELVIQTLESSGQLGTLRAQLRSCVFKIIEGQESGRGAQWENTAAMKAMETAQGQLACELFRDFLEHFKMDYTLNVFLPECNLPNEKKNKIELCKKLGLNQEVQGPILFALIERGSGLGNEKGQIVQEKSFTGSEKQQPPQIQNQQASSQSAQQGSSQLSFQKQPQQYPQQQQKQEEDQFSIQKQVRQQQPITEKSKQEQQFTGEKQKQQQQQPLDKQKQPQQETQQPEKSRQTQQLQQPTEKPKLEPLPDIKGNKFGKLQPLNVQDENEQERKRLAEIQTQLKEIEKKDKGNIIAEFKQEEDIQYTDEIEEDIDQDEEDEEIIRHSAGEGESSRRQAESMGISSSLGMDPSVDSLELDKYDYVEKIQKVKQ